MTSFGWPAANTYRTTDVWIAFGDSMCDGRGDIAEAPIGYAGAAKIYMMRADLVYAPLVEPCGLAPGGPSVGVGPWGMFGWLVSQQTGRDTCVLNCGVGSQLTSAFLPGQSRYDAMITRADVMLSRRSTTLRGILMYIGPNDAALVPAPSWLSNVQATLAALRTRYGKTAAQCPCIYSDLTVDVANDVGPTYRWWDATTAAAAGGGANVRTDAATLADANHKKITPPTPANRDGVHHKTGQNYTIAQSALALAMAHPSWA